MRLLIFFILCSASAMFMGALGERLRLRRKLRPMLRALNHDFSSVRTRSIARQIERSL